MRSSFLILVALFSVKTAICQKDSVYVQINIDSFRVINGENLMMMVTINNHSNETIRIPSDPKFSVYDDVLGEIKLELSVIWDDCFKRIESDIGYNFLEDYRPSELETLNPQNSKVYKCKIQDIYMLQKRPYRVRVHFLYHTSTDRVFAKSKWAYFEVASDASLKK